MDSVYKYSRTAFAPLAHWPAEDPTACLKLVAVAGVGRTTTSYLIPSVLAAGGYPTGVYGCVGAFDGCRWELAAPPSNVPGRFARWMAGLAANGCSHGVIEHGASFFSSGRPDFSIDVACITEVGSRRTLIADAAELLRRVAPEGFVIVNADDEGADDLLAEIDGPVLSVGMKRPAEITATLIERYPSEQTFLLSAGNESIAVRTRLGGDDSLTSCLMAAAVGSVYGVDLPAIVRGLEAIERIPEHGSSWEQAPMNRAA